MRQSIELHPSASRDIEETVEWYNAKQEGLGYKFYLDFLAVYELISTYPRIAPKVYKENRRALLVSFPYGVLYQIQGGRVIIIAVLHTKEILNHLSNESKHEGCSQKCFVMRRCFQK